MVQSILNSMDGSQVNSYTDTLESTAIATIIQDNYNYIIAQQNLPEDYTLFELTASGDSSIPTVMYIPSGYTNLEWIKYNTATTGDAYFEEVQYLDLDQFLQEMYLLNTTMTGVAHGTITIGTDTIDLFFHNNDKPRFYTTFNDSTILFDSYNNSVDTTLQKTKTLAYGLKFPTFTLADATIPTLNEDMFPLLLNESKAQAFVELKQAANANAERKARKGWINSQSNRKSIKDWDEIWDRLPNYGRVRGARIGRIPKALMKGT